MVDITEISAIVAAIGVIVGVVFTVLELRNITKARQTDIFWRLYQSFNTKEYLEAWMKVFNLEFRDYNEFTKKYGLLFSEGSVSGAMNMVGNLFEGTGILLNKRLIDFDLVYRTLPVNVTWEKMKPIAEGARKQYGMPSLFEWFEYLYNEMKKRKKEVIMNG